MIGKMIRQRRHELHMTQLELANRMGYKTKSSIAHIERGTNDIPLSKVEQFAAALSTTVGYLMGWEKEERERLYFDKLFGMVKQLDDADRERLEERVATMLESEKYK